MSSLCFSLCGFAANNVNLFKAISDTDLVGLLCLVTCLSLSEVSWAIILFKMQQIKRSEYHSSLFMRVCNSNAPLDRIYQDSKRFPASPKAHIFAIGYDVMLEENWFLDKIYSEEGRLRASHLALERQIESTIIEDVRNLESWLMFLATTCNVAPFIGLFGTVWGVLGAFQALSSTAGAANIQNLAPGMATALVAVIMGLTAAIPASVAYNYFTNKIGVMTGDMDSFALQTMDALQKEVLVRASNRPSTQQMPSLTPEQAAEYYRRQQTPPQQYHQQHPQPHPGRPQQQSGGRMFD